MKVPFFDIKRQYNTIKEEIQIHVNEVMESCSFIGGNAVKDFEEKIANYLGVKYALGCGNGTVPLILFDSKRMFSNGSERNLSTCSGYFSIGKAYNAIDSN